MFARVPFKTQFGRAHAGLLNAKASKPSKEKVWKAKLTAEQILDLRTKYEYQHWTRQMIMDHFQIDYNAVIRYTEYYTARHLIPKKP